MDTVPVAPEPATVFASVVAVRLADEGIPVRAIARAVHLPSDEVYETLRVAIQQGIIVAMPKDDWPPGTIRSHRSVFNGTALEEELALKGACARFFKASPLEAAMLATMLKRDQVTKSQLHAVVENNRPGDRSKDATDPKMVDVMICKLRKKLKPHDILIETMWGTGYLIPPRMRELAIDLLIKSTQ